MGQAFADSSNKDFTTESFCPGGCTQKGLRHMAAIEIRNNPDCYPGAGLGKPGFATRMSKVGVEADGTIMQALAPSLWCEVRIWKAHNDAPLDQPA